VTMPRQIAGAGGGVPRFESGEREPPACGKRAAGDEVELDSKVVKDERGSGGGGGDDGGGGGVARCAVDVVDSLGRMWSLSFAGDGAAIAFFTKDVEGTVLDTLNLVLELA